MIRSGCLALFLLCGCVGVRYVPAEPFADPELVQRLTGLVDGSLPATYRMVHRVVIVAADQHFDFVGILIVKRGEAFRALGVGEMGGRFFDLLRSDGRRRVLLKPDGMSSGPLIDGVIGDLRHLFDPRLGPEPRAARSEAGWPVLTVPGEQVTREYVFNPPGKELVGSLEAEDGRVVRRAWYGKHSLFPGWERPLPAHIEIENLRWHYRLEIEILQLDLRPDTSKAFAAP